MLENSFLYSILPKSSQETGDTQEAHHRLLVDELSLISCGTGKPPGCILTASPSLKLINAVWIHRETQSIVFARHSLYDRTAELGGLVYIGWLTLSMCILRADDATVPQLKVLGHLIYELVDSHVDIYCWILGGEDLKNLKEKLTPFIGQELDFVMPGFLPVSGTFCCPSHCTTCGGIHREICSFAASLNHAEREHNLDNDQYLSGVRSENTRLENPRLEKRRLGSHRLENIFLSSDIGLGETPHLDREDLIQRIIQRVTKYARILLVSNSVIYIVLVVTLP